MANFPNGNFTITNNDTGRVLRVRLGTAVDISDHKEGTTFPQYKTSAPWLELGDPDGSIATAWQFYTAEDRAERRPYNQIVSTAVRDLQNIGDYCVGFRTRDQSDSGPVELTSEAEWDEILAREATRKARPEERKRYLSTLIPESMPNDHKNLDDWEGACAVYASDGGMDWIKFRMLAGWEPAEEHKQPLLEAMESYLPELEQDGIYYRPSHDDTTTVARMRACGRDRANYETYRWATDGTHIYAADDKTLGPDRTHWTDRDGHLHGRPPGEPGQSWTITPWTPPKRTGGFTREDIAYTGFFGGIGHALRTLGIT
ncbi:hypothetical protein ACFYTQ_24750 [Nocardia sp. NPDC004068]|uniref:hypothetical protein n=1 Tax=Nocardia sp. NPDC004068 TaxID=3364303 RepID=UPI0036B6C7DB